jgi:imidazoleglycerol-phosphate dehydratase
MIAPPTRFHDLPDGGVEVVRETRESIVTVRLEFGDRRETEIATGIVFFDHMLEMIGWHAELNVEASYATKRFNLRHVVCEDVGIVLGGAVHHLVSARIGSGVASVGEGHGTIDEALAFAMFSLEGRANHHLDLPESQRRDPVEDVSGSDLVQFFEGFAQGSRGTVHLRLLSGTDPHHRWEACFRAFARALRGALAPAAWRAGMTAGVKGTLE